MTDATKEEFRCIVSADLFRRAWFAVSTCETRYYLNGVFIEPCAEGGALLTATDGHCLVSLRDPRAFVEGSAIIHLEPAMRKALKAERNDLLGRKAKGFPERVVVATGGPEAFAYIAASAVNYTTDGVAVEPRDELHDLFDHADRRVVAAQFRNVWIDGTFPDWRRVVPTDVDEQARIGAFNVAILNRLADALGGADRRDRACRVVPSRGGDSLSAPHLVFGANKAVEGFGVLMPLRWFGAEATPTWAPRPNAEKKAA